LRYEYRRSFNQAPVAVRRSDRNFPNGVAAPLERRNRVINSTIFRSTLKKNLGGGRISACRHFREHNADAFNGTTVTSVLLRGICWNCCGRVKKVNRAPANIDASTLLIKPGRQPDDG